MRSDSWRLLTQYLLVLSLLHSAPRAQCEAQRLTAFDVPAGSQFGWDVAVDGTRFVVADPNEGVLQPLRGALYIYQRCGAQFVLEAKRAYTGTGIAANLGLSVAADNDIIAAGAPGDDPAGLGQAGSIWIYEEDAMGKLRISATFNAPDPPEANTNFGEYIDLHGTTVVVGARARDIVALNAGAAYVFEKLNGTWTQTAELLSSDLEAGDFFGSDVAVWDDTIVVGADNDDDLAGAAGAVIVFEKRSGIWTETQKLTTSNGMGGDFFGDRVAIEEDLLVGCAVGTDVPGPHQGSAYVFEKVNGLWVETAILNPSDAAPFQQFASSVAIDGRTIVVGALISGAAGKAYFFREVGGVWTEVAILQPPVGATGDEFGVSVAVEGDWILVGARSADVVQPGDQLGDARIFSLSGTGCASLTATPPNLSLSAGGTQVIDLDVDDSLAGSFYGVIGTTSGTVPGLVLASSCIPLNLDSYLLLTLLPGASPLVGNAGVLDAQGRATIPFVLPPGSDASLVGLVLDHAAVVYRLGPLSLPHVSNPVALTLDP